MKKETWTKRALLPPTQTFKLRVAGEKYEELLFSNALAVAGRTLNRAMYPEYFARDYWNKVGYKKGTTLKKQKKKPEQCPTSYL